MPDRLLTVNEVAEQLRLGRTKIYELISRQDLKSIKFDRARRIPESEVHRLIWERVSDRKWVAPEQGPYLSPKSNRS